MASVAFSYGDFQSVLNSIGAEASKPPIDLMKLLSAIPPVYVPDYNERSVVPVFTSVPSFETHYKLPARKKRRSNNRARMVKESRRKNRK